LAISENVSYGWAHKVVKTLLSQGIAEAIGPQVRIVDTGKILNGVAWERPLQSLIKMEYSSSANSVMSFAIEVTRTLDRAEVNYAFAGYLAGTLLTGAGMRYDQVQLYLPRDSWESIEDMFRGKDTGGIRVQVLVPDREVHAGSALREGVRITSPSQTLLDLAGLGYKGNDMAMAMVKDFARL
jgi:hypothetical protein